MISFKRWVREFFGLSHSQANGFIVLIPLLALIIFSEPAWRWYKSKNTDDFLSDRAKLDSLVQIWETDLAAGKTPEKNAVVPDPFHFNPNQATESDLVRLGFSTSLSARISRYRDKGGKFRVKSDLLKIYGIDSALYERLYAFIDLPEKSSPEKRHTETKKVFEHKKPAAPVVEKFDLNLADTAQLKTIRGIGEKLSLRIVKYRDALGGFIRMEQVAEIFGLDSTVVNRLSTNSFIASGFTPSQIPVNTAGERILAAHPYLSREAARSIVAYRFQHGRFETMDDLRKIHGMDDKTIRKIAPYLTMDD